MVRKRTEPPPEPVTQQEAEALGRQQIRAFMKGKTALRPVPAPNHYGPLKRLALKSFTYQQPETFLQEFGVYVWVLLTSPCFLLAALALAEVINFFAAFAIAFLPGVLLADLFTRSWPQQLWFRAGGWSQFPEMRRIEEETQRLKIERREQRRLRRGDFVNQFPTAKAARKRD